MKTYHYVLFLFILFIHSCANVNVLEVEDEENLRLTEAETNEQLEKYGQAETWEELEELVEPWADDPSVRSIYNPARTILTDLIHTKLQVSFNWEKSQLNGVATITAKPHFYASDKLILDARGMDILNVYMNGSFNESINNLDYTYEDDLKLIINLGRVYENNEKYTVTIEYVSKPDELEMGGSNAIAGDKGLYFINPRGEEKGKMPQIWTQGETQSNSVWFPTIDSPNAKSSQEMYITVQDKYVTLSNGNLLSSKKNNDGTRTDHWKQDLPHAPYLFMMAVGEYVIVRDSYTKKDGTKIDVNYYVEPEHEKDAMGIFGETPKMIRYFSELLGVEYPWDKYNQIVVRDYVSGAMENTGAVIFGDYAYKDAEALLDENDQSTIAHELFHHWFGDLVTCESWANLPLNESFANYSQYLWDEFRYGKDEADYRAEEEADGYYQSASYQGYHDLIWFDYLDKEDMFDGHSYNKGGRILHMLRHYLGDDAFFKGLNLYLTDNQFKAAEFHHLRLAFEEVSGEDLNWFFNQWFLGKGHLILFTEYDFNKENSTVKLNVKQRQNLYGLTDFPVYKIPTEIRIWSDNKMIKHDVVIDKLNQEFEFAIQGELENIQIDPDQVLLGKIYEDKPETFFRHQYYNSRAYKSRATALNRACKINTLETQKLLSDALEDPFWDIRIAAATIAVRIGCISSPDIIPKVLDMAKNDSVSKVRSAMLLLLNKVDESEGVLLDIYKKAIVNDPSALVRSSAFQSLVELNPAQALIQARSMQKGASKSLQLSLAEAYSQIGETVEHLFFEELIYEGGFSGEDELRVMISYLSYALLQDVGIINKVSEVMQYYKKNGGSLVAMYYDQILDYLIEQCLESITLLQESLAPEQEKNSKRQAYTDLIAELELLQAE